MKVRQALLYYDRSAAALDPLAYLERLGLQRHLPQCLAARGHDVEVVVAYPGDREVVEGGVRYAFVRSGPLARLPGLVAARVGRDPARWEPCLGAVRRLAAAPADLWHLYGTVLHLNLFLALGVPRRPPTVLHHHGGEPARGGLGRRAMKRNCGRAARVLFSARELAAPFVTSGLLEENRVGELMESSSSLRRSERAAARAITGMHGDPVCLCAARLHPIKDPLTVLRGFERVVARRPEARLYLCYLSDELLGEVRGWLAARPAVAARVELLGRVSRERMEAVFNSADLLLQASLREHSGFAVLDAMACGVVPVITNLPSFRAMTDHGRFGALFEPGDDEALAAAVLALATPDLPERANEVHLRFERALSFPALAARLEGIYEEVLDEPSR